MERAGVILKVQVPWRMNATCLAAVDPLEPNVPGWAWTHVCYVWS